MSYTILRGGWCDIIVLNVHAPTEDKIDMKDNFYKELERVFDRFPKYHKKILLGDLNTKVGSVDKNFIRDLWLEIRNRRIEFNTHFFICGLFSYAVMTQVTK
jgi:exonuclease III